MRPADSAADRAHLARRDGHEEYRSGIGLGGRYVPPEVIRAQADDEWGSKNRKTFEAFRDWFDQWAAVASRDTRLSIRPRCGRSADPGDVKNNEQLRVIYAIREHPVAMAEYGLAECRVSARRHQICMPRFADQIYNALDHRVEGSPREPIELGERGTLELSSVGHPPA